jgi:hypothetical protein
LHPLRFVGFSDSFFQRFALRDLAFQNPYPRRDIPSLFRKFFPKRSEIHRKLIKSTLFRLLLAPIVASTNLDGRAFIITGWKNVLHSLRRLNLPARHTL